MTAGEARCALTRVVAFHATHSYTNCGPMAPHGHLYRVEVRVSRTLAAGESAVIDLSLLDQILTDEITDCLAGRHVNDVTEMNREPTCEAIASWCWQRIAPRLPAMVLLEQVRVAEDGTLWADCTGVD
ncbi:MAG TPA: 6-carboxytetrahydropterin synthase [Gemmatimonadales bacterium]